MRVRVGATIAAAAPPSAVRRRDAEVGMAARGRAMVRRRESEAVEQGPRRVTSEGYSPGRAAAGMNGDSNRDESFAREALPWLDDVYRFALSLTRDAADADDVVQDTFLRAYRSWHTYVPGSDCRRWLFTICRNAFLRSRERERHHVDLDDGDVEAIASVMVHVQAVRDGADGALTRIDLAPALSDALAHLHEPFRSAVVIVDVEDQSYEAASEILGVPIGTVRSRLFRGRRILQEMLLDYATDAGFATAVRPSPAARDE